VFKPKNDTGEKKEEVKQSLFANADFSKGFGVKN
tara:strand:- start:404 stop:505 length:102 start_codon:yes stop_codon:yes gene_type:complete